MRCSHNEIAALAHRVAVASGFPHGVAADLGRAAAWLCGRGFDGLGVVMATSGPAGCAGPAMLDLLVSGARDELRSTGMDAPLLLVGLCGVWAIDHGGDFAIVVGDADYRAATLRAESIGPAFDDPAAKLHITRIAPVEATTAPGGTAVAGDAITVDPVQWKHASRVAERTYVPESDTSRQSGAGADTDGSVDPRMQSE